MTIKSSRKSGLRSDVSLSTKVKQGDDLHSHAQFFEAYSSKLNVSVVAIRGTDVGRISDLIEDIKVGVARQHRRQTRRGGRFLSVREVFFCLVL